MEEGLEGLTFVRYQKTHRGERHHKTNLSSPAPHKPTCLNTLTYVHTQLYIMTYMYTHKHISLYILYI